MIEVEGLTKYYGSYRAIDRLSFRAEPGEIVGFLGRNGAGKTTTMRILAGYMPASEGQAAIGGYDVFSESLQARQVLGYMPENIPLYREMTVWQYLNYMASLRGMKNPDREDRVEEVLERVHLSDRQDSMIANLSKGMKQRVGLAQALVHRPSVLILDEPTIGLDPTQVIDFRELLLEVAEGRTVLLSTHILSEVEKVCSRVIVIDGGKIVAEDRLDRLTSRRGTTSRTMARVGGSVPPADVIAALKGIQGVTKVHQVSDGYEIVAQTQADVRPLVASAIVGRSWDLLELRGSSSSIEDIFIQLTEEEAENTVDDDDA